MIQNHQNILVRRAGKWILVEGSEHRWTEYEIGKSEEKYRTLFTNMLNSFTYKVFGTLVAVVVIATSLVAG